MFFSLWSVSALSKFSERVRFFHKTEHPARVFIFPPIHHTLYGRCLWPLDAYITVIVIKPPNRNRGSLIVVVVLTRLNLPARVARLALALDSFFFLIISMLRYRSCRDAG